MPAQSPGGGPTTQEKSIRLADVVMLRTKTGMHMPVVERLQATAQLNLDWERRLAPGRVSTDSTLLLGLDYVF